LQIKIRSAKSDQSLITNDLTTLLRPYPNSSILGLRVKLYIYNITKTKKTKGLAHWLNTKFGEPPVLISAVDVDKNASILQNRMQNISYFQAHG
jgi:outer membrane protein insertion porin family